jgi:DNA-binding response OmpR family regulator
MATESLTNKQSTIYRAILNAGRPLSCDELAVLLYGEKNDITRNRVKVHIANIRNKGYVIENPRKGTASVRRGYVVNGRAKT